jgi:hypothetical protein
MNFLFGESGDDPRVVAQLLTPYFYPGVLPATLLGRFDERLGNLVIEQNRQRVLDYIRRQNDDFEYPNLERIAEQTGITIGQLKGILSYLIRRGSIINLSVHYALQSFPEIAKPTRGCQFCVSENRPSFPIPLEPVSAVYLALDNGAKTFADLWDKIDNLDYDMLSPALNRLEKIGAVEIERGEGNYIRSFKYLWGWRESTKAGG